MGVRINLGCKHHYLDGWVNVDIREDVGADLVCDARGLANYYDNGSIEQIWMSHLLEHFTHHEGQVLLKQLGLLLDPARGKIGVVVPDLYQWAKAYVDDDLSVLSLPPSEILSDDHLSIGTKVASVTHGLDGAHRFMYDKASLFEALKQAGLCPIENINPETEPLMFSRVKWQVGFWCVRSEEKEE